MANDPLFLLMLAAMAVVVIILLVGIGGFAKGGAFNRKHANRIMRYRIYAQLVAVVIIVAVVYIRRTGG